MRIAVCRPQVPFVYGGAEVVADQLVDELRIRGHEVELVAIPFAWTRRARARPGVPLAAASTSSGTTAKPVDLVIATKFPSLRRSGTRTRSSGSCTSSGRPTTSTAREFGQFSESPVDRATRLGVERFDRVALGEARRIFTISGNVAERLEALLRASTRPCCRRRRRSSTTGPTSYDGFVLSVNRLDRYKRIDLLIEAAKADPALRIVIVGDGPDRARLEQLASGLNGRVEFAGRVDGERARRPLRALPRRLLRAGRRGLRDGPVRGVPLREAGRDDVDAGGPLEVVHDGETGLVVAPEPAELAEACAYLAGAPSTRRSALGEAGKAVAERITWDACIDALLS